MKFFRWFNSKTWLTSCKKNSRFAKQKSAAVKAVTTPVSKTGWQETQHRHQKLKSNHSFLHFSPHVSNTRPLEIPYLSSQLLIQRWAIFRWWKNLSPSNPKCSLMNPYLQIYMNKSCRFYIWELLRRISRRIRVWNLTRLTKTSWRQNHLNPTQ